MQFLSSGHILGSSSLLMEYHGKTILCSSDLGAKGLLTVKEPVEVKPADVLIVEATFGSPELRFPPREEIALSILKWSAEVIKEKRNVILSAGKIGSAQELIKLFNDFTNLRVITHGDVTPPSKVYQKHGVPLRFFDSKSEEGREIIRNGEAVIIQSRAKKLVPFYLKEHKNYRSAIITGMASRFAFKNYDAAFPLSSHASFKELLEYVAAAEPELVFTLYGFEKQLAKAISHGLNIPAQALKGKSMAQNSTYVKQPSELEEVATTNINTKLSEQQEEGKEALRNLTPAVNNPKNQQTLDDFFKKKK